MREKRMILKRIVGVVIVEWWSFVLFEFVAAWVDEGRGGGGNKGG